MCAIIFLGSHISHLRLLEFEPTLFAFSRRPGGLFIFAYWHKQCTVTIGFWSVFHSLVAAFGWCFKVILPDWQRPSYSVSLVRSESKGAGQEFLFMFGRH